MQPYTKVAAIYARQSLDVKDSLSIEGQIERGKAQLQPSEPFEVYVDKGFSGKNTNRPDLQRLLSDVKQGRISRVICYRIDRISRSISDFGYIWDTLSQYGVEFTSVNENFDTSTPIGRAMLYIIMVFAQLERETIAERVRDNYYQRVKAGGWPGGPAPYGYEILKEKGSLCTLTPTPEIDIVCKMFELYTQPGASLGSVADWLNAHHIPCVRRATWDTVSAGRVLRQPAYVRADPTVYAYYKAKGVVMTNSIEDFDGEHAILIVGKRNANERKYQDLHDHVLTISHHIGHVDAGLFLAVQHKLDQNKQIANTGKGKYTWLSGLLKCAKCGYSLRVINDPKAHRPYLVCSGRTNYKICTHRHSERLEDVEASVEAAIIHYLRTAQKRQAEHQVDTGHIQASIAIIDEKINKLVEKIPDAAPATMRYINAELEKLDQERSAAYQELEAAFDSRQDLSQIANLDFASLPFEEKKAIASIVVAKVLCSSDSTTIEWKL